MIPRLETVKITPASSWRILENPMFQFTNISIIILASTAVNILTAIIAWKRRNTKGGIYFATALMAIAFWSLAAALDYAAVPIPLKVFFAKLEYAGYLSALALMTAFSMVYAGYEHWLNRTAVRIVLLVVPVSSILLAWTNDLHGWLWTDFIPSAQGNNVVIFEHGPGFLWVSLSGYLLIAIILLNLLQSAITGKGLLRRQAILMLLALMVPMASNFLYLFNILDTPGVDWSSITFSITAVLFLFALYGSRFMEIVPTARNVMIDEMEDGILVFDDQGRLVDFNPSARALFEISRNDLWNSTQTSVLKRFPAIAALLAESSGHGSLDMELGDKSYIAQRTPLLNQNNFAYGQLVVMHDITTSKQVEETLRNRTNILATLQQTMLDLVNRHDVEDVLQTLLPRIGGLLKAQHVSIDLLEEPDLLITHAVTPRQPLQKGDRMRRGEGGWLSWQAIETGEPAVMEDYSAWANRRDLFEGFPIHAIAIIPIHQRERVIGAINFSRGEPGKPFSETEIFAARQLAQMVALVLDNANLYTQLKHELAERKQMQEVLRINQENFMGYFNMGAVGMCVTTSSQNWVEVNDQLCHMLGYSKEELKRLTWSGLTHPDDLEADLELFNQAMRGERDTYQIDKRFIRRDGGVLHASVFVSCQRFPDGSPRYFLASLVDISKRVEQEVALRATQDQLAEQRRSMAVFEERQRLARDLHDSVSQSLHSLNLFSETLTSSLAKGNPDRTLQLAERLQESARQALKETRLMLYQLQPSRVDAATEVDLVREIESRLSSVEERAGVRASLNVEGDAGQCPAEWRENLFRITIEALNNSLKHAQARNVKVTIRCDASAVEINVSDDGIGFDPLRARRGGMGLRSMRERAELIGGTLEIRSSPNEGTSVIVRVEKK